MSYEESMAEAVRLGLMTTAGNATDRCQCTECGRVFSTVANFDRHLRSGRQLEDGRAWCVAPETVGLVQDIGGWWKQPAPDVQPQRGIAA